MGIIHFQGSKERLQRIVARSNGDWLPDRRFGIKMRDRSKKLPFLTFSFRCQWEPADEGIRISYTVFPTVPTLIFSLLAFAFFAFPVFAAEPVTGGYFVVPILIVLVFVSQMRNAAAAFRDLFSTPTF